MKDIEHVALNPLDRSGVGKMIRIIRDKQVLLDSDLAILYGVETNVVEKKKVVKNFDHLAKLKYSPVNPTAFTERCLYMLATILKGSVATQTTINIINTFVEI